MNRLDTWAGCLYLELVCARGYEEQEPQYRLAKWYDLLWLLIPIAGMIPFMCAIEARTDGEGEH